MAPRSPIPRTNFGELEGYNAIRLTYAAVYRLLPFIIAAALATAQESPLERAVILARGKRYADARNTLEAIAEPAGTEQRIAFHRLKAAVASGLGEARNAAAEMRAALELAPEDAGLLMATAVAEREAGLLDDALRHVHSSGNSAAAQEIAGGILEKRGAYVEAANAYKAAVVLAPDREEYRIALSLELVQHQAFEPAIQVLKQAAPLFPKSAKMRTLLGIAHYAMGQIEEAEASLGDAIQLDKNLEPAYKYLARIAIEGSGAPSIRTIDVLCGWDATVCDVLKLRLAMEKGDAALQTRAIDRLRAAPADSAIARCELGFAFAFASQLAAARTHMEACVRLDPSPLNHYRLGRLYRRLGLEDLAHQQMELRNAAAERLNEQVSRRENAVQAFRYVIK